MPIVITAAAKVVPYAKAIAFGLVACVACSLVSFVLGAWAGIEWQQGRHAQAENQTLKTDVESLLAAAVELRQRGADIAQDFRIAHRRMEAITDEHNKRDADTRRFFDNQSEALAALVAANPGLRAVCLDARGVQHWNDAARRARAAGAAPEHSDQRPDPVPGGTTDAARRDGRSDPAGLRSGGGAVPHLRGSNAHGRRADRSVRGRSMATLLQGDGGAVDRRRRLSEVTRG